MTEKTAAEAQEIEATSDGYIPVEMTGYDGTTKSLHIQLATRWRSSALRALNTRGDIDTFMSLVLHEDDYETYLDLDPAQEDIQAFVEDAQRLAGEALGKSSGPTRSSRSTRRR